MPRAGAEQDARHVPGIPYLHLVTVAHQEDGVGRSANRMIRMRDGRIVSDELIAGAAIPR